MILSDWDVLAVDENCVDVPVSLFKGGAIIGLYQNLILLEDGHNGTCVRMSDGDFLFDDVVVIAKSSPKTQNAVFYFISYLDEANVLSAEELEDIEDYEDIEIEQPEFKIIAGIGCKGYIDNVHDILRSHGITVPAEFEYFTHIQSLNSSVDSEVYLISYKSESGVTFDVVHDATKTGLYLQRKYVGVEQKTYDAFLSWLNELVNNFEGIVEDKYELEVYSKWLTDVETEYEPNRYNQGDLVFSKEQIEAIPNELKTKIGMAKPPIIDLLMTE